VTYDVTEPFGDQPMVGVVTGDDGAVMTETVASAPSAIEEALRARVEGLLARVAELEADRVAAVDVAYEFGCPNAPHPGVAGCAYCSRIAERFEERKGIVGRYRAEMQDRVDQEARVGLSWREEAAAAVATASGYERERDKARHVVKVYGRVAARYSERIRDAIRCIDTWERGDGPAQPDPEAALLDVRTVLQGGASEIWCTCRARTKDPAYHERFCAYYRGNEL